MTTHDQIPPPVESTTRLRPTPPERRSATLGRATCTVMNADRTPPPAPARGDRTDDRAALLRAQPWGKLITQLTTIALKRTGGRSLEDAEDFAQTAITDAYRSPEAGGWDPAKGPLENFLVARVIGDAANQRRRKRNVCEVWLDEEVEEAPGRSVHEKHLAEDKPAPDDALHRLRFASTFDERLTERVAANELATALLPLMREGLSTPRDLAAATGRSVLEVRTARRFIRYHADAITKELSATAGSPGSGDGSKEVIQ